MSLGSNLINQLLIWIRKIYCHLKANLCLQMRFITKLSPISSSSWAEFVLMSIYTPTRLDNQKSSENLLLYIISFTLVKHKTTKDAFYTLKGINKYF